MIFYSSRVRIRHVIPVEEREMWLSLLRESSHKWGWRVSRHAQDNVRSGRVDVTDIERLKALEDWYVWAYETGTDDPRLREAKLKLVVRYPSFEPDCWQIEAVVAVGKPLYLVTIFVNSNVNAC